MVTQGEYSNFAQLTKAETTVYSDRLLLHYPPISDVFDNIENFFCIKQMIQL